MVGFWKSNTEHDAVGYLKSKNQNVIISETFDPSIPLFQQRQNSYGYSLPSHLGRWYIRQKLSIQRRYLEIKNNIKYELVVYIRPDVCFYQQTNRSHEACNHYYQMMRDNELLRTRYQLQAGGDYTDFWNHNQAIREIGIDDVFTVAGSLTADIFDHCYTEYNDATPTAESYKLGFGDSHLPTATYLTQHSITSSYNSDTLRGKFVPLIIRPHVTREMYDDIQIVESSVQLKYANEWKLLTTDTKKDWCLKSNIDFQDYDII
jgi:hypothetical protein